MNCRSCGHAGWQHADTPHGCEAEVRPKGDEPERCGCVRPNYPARTTSQPSIPIGGDLCSTADAAEILGISHDVVKAMTRSGVLPPEAVVSRTSLWTRSVLERWDALGRPPGVLPPAPRLEVLGLREIASRYRVSDACAKKWVLHGALPEATWRTGGLLLWSRSDFNATFPICPKCEVPVDVVDSRSETGKASEIKCGCGTWVTARPRREG